MGYFEVPSSSQCKNISQLLKHYNIDVYGWSNYKKNKIKGDEEEESKTYRQKKHKK